jgi:hypothetical protein
LQRLIHTCQGLFCLIAGGIISGGTFQHTGAEFAISVGTDDGQYGKRHQAEDHEYQKDRGGSDIHAELFFSGGIIHGIPSFLRCDA